MSCTKSAPRSSAAGTGRHPGRDPHWPVNGRQHVPGHPAPLQQVQAADHPVEGGLAALVHPVGIMQVAGSVDGDPDQESCSGKKGGPLVVEEVPLVCNRVFDRCRAGRALRPVSRHAGRSPGPSSWAHHPARATVTLRASMGLQQLPRYWVNRSWLIRNSLPGYNSSLDRKSSRSSPGCKIAPSA